MLAIATRGQIVDFPSEANVVTTVEYASGAATGTYGAVYADITIEDARIRIE